MAVARASTLVQGRAFHWKLPAGSCLDSHLAYLLSSVATKKPVIHALGLLFPSPKQTMCSTGVVRHTDVEYAKIMSARSLRREHHKINCNHSLAVVVLCSQDQPHKRTRPSHHRRQHVSRSLCEESRSLCEASQIDGQRRPGATGPRTRLRFRAIDFSGYQS
jgi:hypothetical protein